MKKNNDMVQKRIKKTKINLLVALKNSLGIVTGACKEVGISRKTFYDYYKSDPEFAAEVDSLDDYTIDFVEHQLFKKIKDGSERSILFYMQYKGKKRGYTNSNSIEINQKTEQPLFSPKKDNDDNE